MAEVGPAFTPPAEFEEFRLIGRIGAGAMGQVYLARDLLLDRLVAVKFIAAPRPDERARERFFIEARAAARLSHPNVVTVFRVGELGRRPYLIAEFIRGESLDRLPKPLPYERTLELALGLARGLAAAHHGGVLHRDLKPANAILADGGTIKLVDFGLAKLLDAASLPLPAARAAPVAAPLAHDGASVTLPGHAHGRRHDTASISDGDGDGGEGEGETAAGLTREGTVLGTPRYMAPEVWRGEPATTSSDVYSLGALLYELASGAPPHGDVAGEELAAAVCTRDAAPLGERAGGVDARFAALVDRCLQRDAQARFASAEPLRDALAELAAAPRAGAVPDGNPYRGLRPFEAEHRALFFGRGAEITRVGERLRAEPLVLVAGDSGVGKSSLCRAGVLPLVAEVGLGDGRRWSAVTLVPGSHPMQTLAAALGVTGGDGARLDEPRELVRQVRALHGADAGLVLFVDQLEELITVSAGDEAARFARLLGRLATPVPGLRLLGTVRGDFITRLAELPGLRDELARALVLLGPLGPDGLREAIVGPARHKGVELESGALVESLVAAGAGAGLPLLEFALAELWEARDRSSRVIRAAALDEAGGVSGALARHGDRVLATLGPAERRAARRVLLKLVTPAGTGARRLESELGTSAADAAALEALVRGRLLVPRQSDEGVAYQIAHEALLSGWATLRAWLGEAADTRAAEHRLEVAAAEWLRLGRAPEALWSARQLAELGARDGGGERGPREVEFVAAARRALRRRRLGRGLLVFGVPLALAAVLTGSRLANRRAVAARVAAHAERAAAALAAADADADGAATLRARALGQFDARERDAAERTWATALAAATAVDAVRAGAAQELEAALILDGSRADLRARLGAVLYARALAAEEAGRAAERDELRRRMALYDDGGVLAHRFDAPAELAIASTPAGAAVRLGRYQRAADGSLALAPARALGSTPLAVVTLPPGSYLVELDAPGRAPLRLPVLLSRGEHLTVAPALPLAAAVPDGFVYVPPGRFLFGTANEAQRRDFYNTTPLHARATAGYLIALHETTYAEWIAFLEALPAAERTRRTPGVAAGFRGMLALTRGAPGRWRLKLQPSTEAHEAEWGEPLRYPGRGARAAQDWRRFPVAGVSFDDVEAYTRWLGARVPGARPCREDEWERAARGADGRDFPHGDRLAPDDANFDQTYSESKDPRLFGPDEVGAHPASRSPFGVDDLTGNVWEATRSVLAADEMVLRGGSYYFAANSGRSANREVSDRGMRELNLGVRVCADAPAAP